MKISNYLSEYLKSARTYNLWFATSLISGSLIFNSEIAILLTFLFIIFAFLNFNCKLTRKFIKNNKLSSLKTLFLLVHSFFIGFFYVAPILFLRFNSFEIIDFFDEFFINNNIKNSFVKKDINNSNWFFRKKEILFTILFQLIRSKYFLFSI